MELFFIADIIGLVAFAISGFLVGVRKNLDLLGVLISSSLTALGGGVLRDVLTNNTPKAFLELYPSILIISSVFIAYFLKLHLKDQIDRRFIFVLSDSIGLVAFSITGALIAISHELNVFGVALLSFVTAVGGGVIRDILVNEVPFVLVSEFYGTISILIAFALLLLDYYNLLNNSTILIVAILALLLRVVAHLKKWGLPTIKNM